jgi:hypothetical protein
MVQIIIKRGFTVKLHTMLSVDGDNMDMARSIYPKDLSSVAGFVRSFTSTFFSLNTRNPKNE